MHLTLTAADHKKNGFVSLANWKVQSEKIGLQIIEKVDAMIPDGSEPDVKECEFNFILDLNEDTHNLLHETTKPIPTQVAMKLAPDQVQKWLNERPEPDTVIDDWGVLLEGIPAI